MISQDEAALLQAVHTTAEMGKNTLGELLSRSKDPAFSDRIRKQQQTYEQAAAEARTRLLQGGVTPEKKPLSNAMAAMGLRMNTLLDNSSSHMAQRMIEGSTMGIVELQQQLNSHPRAEGEARRLAEKLLAFEEKSVEELKRCL